MVRQYRATATRSCAGGPVHALRALLNGLLCVVLVLLPCVARSQDALGGIGGTVTDEEFDVPLNGVTVVVLETNAKTETDESGHFVFHDMKPGAYTLTAMKPGFMRVMKGNVVVAPGSVKAVAISMPAEHAELQEFVVRPLKMGDEGDEAADLASSLGSDLSDTLANELASQLTTEIALLNLRAETMGIMDAVGAEFMSRAGASSAADAMKLVSGATVADGKYAVIRGLSDRFINTRVNGIMMPTADPDVRAVQLDLFPSALLESVRVYKTFTPDLPANTSGGSVDIVTPNPPQEFSLSLKGGIRYNSQATGNSKFLTSGQDFDYWGLDKGDRKQTVQSGKVDDPGNRPRTPFDPDNPDENWTEWLKKARVMDRQVRSMSPVMGPVRETAPFDHSWGLTYGDRLHLSKDISLGWLAAYTYSSKYEYYDNGVDRSLVSNGDMASFKPLIGSSEDNEPANTAPDQYETEEGTHTVGWGLGTVLALDFYEFAVKLNYLRTQHTEEKASLFIDDKTNPVYGGRNESLVYTARSMESIQLQATTPLAFLDIPELFLGFDPGKPVLEWAGATSKAVQDQPDRRFFLGNYDKNFGYWKKPWYELNFAERSWRTIEEQTDFYRADLSWPFEIGDDREGKLKFGYSDEDTGREYTQDTVYYQQGDGYFRYYSSFEEPWSRVFLDPDRIGFPIFGLGADYDPDNPGEQNWIIEDFQKDINYTGELQVKAMYGMAELPLFPWLKFIGGMRIEDTAMATEVHAASGDDDNVQILDVRSFLNPAEDGVRNLSFESPATSKPPTTLEEMANASIQQVDRLPSLGVVLNVVGAWTLRGTWSRTIGRPTFKELTPVAQQDHLGGQAFAGNPALTISQLTNYDLRLEWNPGDGRLFSVSGFMKEIEDPIDYSLRPTTQNQLYILPFNYPEGQVTGFEVEARFPLGGLHRVLNGFSVGANFTMLDATVTLPDYEAQELKDNLENAEKDTSQVGERRMKDQPEYIANFYVLYDLERTGTSIGVFLNHTGETLVAGESFPTAENYFPNLMKKPVTSLDVNITQKLWEHGKLSLSLGNLLNPEIEEVWQSDYVDQGEATATSYRKGITVSVGLSGSW